MSHPETVVVTGGCGFIGYHIIKHLRQQRPSWSIHGVSRSPESNTVEGAQYHAIDIADHSQVLKLFNTVLPTVIVHAASPPVVGRQIDDKTFMRTNVDGTRCVLDCSLAIGTVKAFVYTSTVGVIEGDSHHFATENLPTKNENRRCDAYSKSKAIAERLVLGCNGKSAMLTISLRLPSTYGERDHQNIGESLLALRRGEQKLQIGNNKNLNDLLSASNAARAHLVAVDALLAEHETHQISSETHAAGEAFFITDGKPMPFWDFFRLIWRAAGDKTSIEEVSTIPPWLIMSVAGIVEIMYWLFTLGTVKPQSLRRDLLKYTFLERTFSIQKAQRVLGYQPVDDREEQIAAGVKWFQSK